jgi:hypothetical protein
LILEAKLARYLFPSQRGEAFVGENEEMASGRDMSLVEEILKNNLGADP